MKSLARILAEYVFNKGMITKEECQEYEYGFVIAMEKGLSLIISLCIAVLMNAIVEAVLFFIIFIPLRKYAGGLHLSKYSYCLILSCLTFSAVMYISKFLQIDSSIALLLIICMDLLIIVMYPVENINRDVDEKENIFFKKRLERNLLINLVIAMVCILFNKRHYLLVIVGTLVMITSTMYIGKIKYNKEKKNPSL